MPSPSSLPILALLLVSLTALSTTSIYSEKTVQISVQQGDTYTLDPRDYGLFYYLRGNRTQGPNFITVPPIGSLERRQVESVELSTAQGSIGHVAIHPSHSYIYFFHTNVTANAQSHFVEVFSYNVQDTTQAPHLIRAGDFSLQLPFIPDRSYNISLSNRDLLILEVSSSQNIAIIDVTTPASVTYLGQAALPTGVDLSRGSFAIYRDILLIPRNSTQFSAHRLSISGSGPNSASLINLEVFTISTAAHGISNTAQITDIAVDPINSFVHLVFRGQGILSGIIDVNLSGPQFTEISYLALPNIRQVAINPKHTRLLVLSTLSGQQGGLLEYLTLGSSSANFEYQLRFNQSEVFTPRNGAQSHSLLSSPHIGLIQGSFSLAVATNLPVQFMITSLSHPPEISTALLWNQNQTFAVAVESFGNSPNMQLINVYSVDFAKYGVRIDPQNNYLGNFDASLLLEGASCDFNSTGSLQPRSTPDFSCSLMLSLKVEVKGYGLTTMDTVTIVILVVLVVGIAAVAALVVCKICKAKRKISKEKYKRGIPEQVELQPDVSGTGGYEVTKGIDIWNGLYAVDERPAEEETTPQKMMQFPDNQQGQSQLDQSQIDDEQSTLRSGREEQPEAAVAESPIKPRNLHFEDAQ